MKFTLGWLKDHLETDATLDEITEKLTLIGLEVESVTDRAKGMEGFKVARVLEAKQHPNADRLRVCHVDYGDGDIELVCGAPNARTGLVGVFAPEGSYIPGIDLTLKPTEIRGVVSSGMLLSEREMGLSDEHDGIIELPEDSLVGTRAVDALGLADPVIEIAITPNRGDCLGVRGIARDLAAGGLGALKPLKADPVVGTFESPLDVALDFPTEKASACSKFVGRAIKGVTNGPSPKWVQDRLNAIGLRPISALVDVTNLVSFEYGRPLHVFDADKVTGDTITARLARPGEKITALGGTEYTLDGDMTVIADANGPEAVAGVIGGEHSGCTEDTTSVFLEVAYFDPVRTAMTGRKLNVQTDARYRFERGVDPAFLENACEIATRLILEFCGGEASNVVSAGAGPGWQRTIDFDLGHVKALGGTDVPRGEILRILGVLGFEIVADAGDQVTVQVPSWRSDVEGSADLVEEVIRIHGYDKIPTISLDRPTALPEPALKSDRKRRAQARRVLAARGLTEAVTYSFMSAKDADLFRPTPDALKLINPISADLDAMRPSILGNLMSAAQRNAARGIADAALFEVGPEFEAKGQRFVAAGLRSGKTGGRHWAEPPRPVDAYDVKADVAAVLEDLGFPSDRAQVADTAPAWYHPGRSGVLQLGPKNVLAAFGEVHPRLLKAFGLKGRAAAFEIYLENLPGAKQKGSAARAPLSLSQFQSVHRDFAFVLATDVPAAKVIAAAKGADKKLITDVEVFDLFEGESLGADKKSLAITVTIEPTQATFTDAEIEAISDKIVAAVAKATGGELRG